MDWHAENGQPNLQQLLEQFQEQFNHRAAIVGPHGSGKSTLLEHLVPRIGKIVLRKTAYPNSVSSISLSQEVNSSSADGSSKPHKEVVWLALRGQRESRNLIQETQRLWNEANRVLVIDGFEQLSWWYRWKITLATRRVGAGLLVTSHQRTWLPTLLRTLISSGLLQELLTRLVPVDNPLRQRLPGPAQLEELLQKHHGNLREVFMQLYDEFERAEK